MNTLIQEKANVVRLRTLLEKETDPLAQEFIQYRLGAARFRHDIAEFGVLTPERIEQVKTKARHRVKCMVIAISIAVILAIVLFAGSGCNAIDGLRTDIHQWTDNPAHHQENNYERKM